MSSLPTPEPVGGVPLPLPLVRYKPMRNSLASGDRAGPGRCVAASQKLVKSLFIIYSEEPLTIAVDLCCTDLGLGHANIVSKGRGEA
jgi:hypothetical protein